jgi:hypothetical protein
MIHTRFRPAVAAVCLAAGLSLPAPSDAQTRTARGQTSAPAPVETNSPQTPTGLNQNATETRRQFYKILEQYPPALGRVLRLDPTLLTNQGYLASYPNVAAFVSQYPDIPRNPGYYLERYDPDYQIPQPPDARREAIRMWNDILSFAGAFAIFCVVTFALFGIIKYIVEYRRWQRISKVNTEVHNKILDRFGSNEELLAYIDSPAGRRFLEAAPMAPASAPAPPVAAPFGRILLSVQIGVILVALGIGLMIIGNRAIEEIQQVILGLSVIGFALGIGCVVSAAASYVLSRRLGLLQNASAGPPPHSVA